RLRNEDHRVQAARDRPATIASPIEPKPSEARAPPTKSPRASASPPKTPLPRAGGGRGRGERSERFAAKRASRLRGHLATVRGEDQGSSRSVILNLTCRRTARLRRLDRRTATTSPAIYSSVI